MDVMPWSSAQVNVWSSVVFIDFGIKMENEWEKEQNGWESEWEKKKTPSSSSRSKNVKNCKQQ